MGTGSPVGQFIPDPNQRSDRTPPGSRGGLGPGWPGRGGLGVKRVFVYLSALVGVGGIIYLTGRSEAQQPGAPAPVAAVRPTIAVFNMPAVMKDYGKAKYQVYKLNEKRVAISGDIVKMRSDAIATKQAADMTPDPKLKEEHQKKLVNLARMLEDRERDVQKTLNDDASAIISTLYDDIKTVVDKTAEMNGYHIVFAYPDTSTPEDQKNPYFKEMKLKPTAALPFYVSPQVDITAVVVATLNKWYPAPAVPATPPEPKNTPQLPGPGQAGGPPAQPQAQGVPPQPGQPQPARPPGQ